MRPDGTGARSVTGGLCRRQGIVFRRESVDPDEKTIARDRPLLLSALDNRPKASGFYRVSFADASLTKLVMVDKAVNIEFKLKADS
ncbi:MAG: hypothetical protein HYZ58_03435 [Acidobacteria bacterium]|nr:hypothetical protein [Acidobacteriota bacterium]